jgi:hypothetical protein
MDESLIFIMIFTPNFAGRAWIFLLSPRTNRKRKLQGGASSSKQQAVENILVGLFKTIMGVCTINRDKIKCQICC